MDALKKLFGDKAITYAELEKALEGNKEIKLANLASGGYVDKAKFTAAETQISDLKSQISQRDKDLEELKKLDAAGLKQQLNDLQAKYDTDTKAYNDKLTAQTINSHIELKLTAAKAKNLTAVKALINLDNVKLDGDKLLGFDDQLKEITKNNPYLFGEVEKNPPPPGAGGTGGGADDMAKWRAEAGLPPLKQ